jgi:hypothetical protein
MNNEQLAFIKDTRSLEERVETTIAIAMTRKEMERIWRMS